MPNYILGVKSNEKPLLISDEYLSAHYFLDAKGYRFGSRYDIANRLKKLFPNANIIIVLRNKDEWVKSFYVQYIKSVSRPNISFDEFKDILYKSGTLDFEQYVKYLREKFTQVLVLHYEELKNNPKEFIRKICEFIGVEMPANIENRKTNIRLSNRQLSFIKWVKNRRIKSEYKKKIIDIFLFLTGGKK